MLVYGDRHREVATRDILSSGDFFQAAELAQGLVDAEFQARGIDELTPLHLAAVEHLRELAAGRAADALTRRMLPRRVTVKEPEGYAFYAVAPEAYADAARQVAWPSPPLVIGLRSIGLSLAAVVAEAVGADFVVSVRPVGPPFRRELRLSDRLRARLAAHDGPYAVVDEGPGLSGSAFGAVLRELERLGVGPERITLFPSHAGAPGAEASADVRRLWNAVRRVVAPPLGIDGLFDDLIGPTAQVEDLSGGAWRRGRGLPSFPQQERLKFRLSTPQGVWLARFAGLGEAGGAKLNLARRLHAAGMGPEPVALRQGFLLSRWVDGGTARPSASELAAYLDLRRRQPAEPGASLESLAEMVRVNAAELGLKLSPEPPADAGSPVAIDGRLHAWEWLRTPEGRLVKVDGLDHHRAHDLIGGQDIAWDVAGAAVELGLDDVGVDALCARLGANARLVAFHRLAYPAFQAGLWSFAGDPAQVARYRGVLATAAGLDGSPTERSRTCLSRQT
ncbi:hypothetical protein LRS10_19575 [Phenylobacterium sp. J426]|uniref:hypothetical protein n=1 Tax=Phenylobacterium sp. J426 TaxID=2898439 RepID=UPI0021512C45|nr:hypothetical protein [Phenylobacterium sp. J426]MCR5876151.1 hypothetical protein [Phenylobacterium sp. J426]